jgi:hypothetical protein
MNTCLQSLARLCAGALALAWAHAVAAQDAATDVSPAEAAPAPPVCELHVWPGSPVRSTYSGWFHGGIVDGAVQGRDGYKKLPDSILSAETQLQTLREVDPAEALRLSGYTVVFHDQPLPSRAIRAATGRVLADTPPCYAEFITDDVFFQQDIIDGRFIKAIFRFRQFDGSAEAPVRTFGTYVQYRLTQFPPAEPEQLEVALEEFRLAYGQSVRQFGAALNKPAKPKKGKAKS